MNLKASLFNAFTSRDRPRADRLIRSAVSAHEGNPVRDLLATRTSRELTSHDIRTVAAGNLWMLTPEAFLYFLPAFLHASLESYTAVSVFASEMIGALTAPSRADVVETLDRLGEASSGLGLPDDLMGQLRKQQLEWYDSGSATALFHERFDNLTPAEGAAVLAFLEAFQAAHGEDFPFDELETAIDRHWARYRES